MGEQKDPAVAVEYHPDGAYAVLPREVESFLLGLPGVSGFRPAGGPEENRIVVMMATPQAAERLPRIYGKYLLDPELTGSFRAY